MNGKKTLVPSWDIMLACIFFIPRPRDWMLMRLSVSALGRRSTHDAGPSTIIQPFKHGFRLKWVPFQTCPHCDDLLFSMTFKSQWIVGYSVPYFWTNHFLWLVSKYVGIPHYQGFGHWYVVYHRRLATLTAGRPIQLFIICWKVVHTCYHAIDAFHCISII